MKSQHSIDRVTKVTILINTLLTLAGIVAFLYDHTGRDTGHWSPVPPPPFVDPFKTYHEPLI